MWWEICTKNIQKMWSQFDFSLFLQNSRHAANIANNESKWHFWSCEVMPAMQKNCNKSIEKTADRIMMKFIKHVIFLGFVARLDCGCVWRSTFFFSFFRDSGPFWHSNLEAFLDKSNEKMRLENIVKFNGFWVSAHLPRWVGGGSRTGSHGVARGASAWWENDDSDPKTMKNNWFY